MSEPLSPRLAADYERDGFVILPGVLSAEECDNLKAEARHVLDTHAQPGASVHVHVAAVSPPFRALAEDPRIVRPLARLMPHGVMFLSDDIALPVLRAWSSRADGDEVPRAGNSTS